MKKKHTHTKKNINNIIMSTNHDYNYFDKLFSIHIIMYIVYFFERTIIYLLTPVVHESQIMCIVYIVLMYMQNELMSYRI